MAATTAKKPGGKTVKQAAPGADLPPLPRADPETVYAGHDNVQLISTIRIDEDHLREREDVSPEYIHGLAQAIAANGLKQAVGVTQDSRLVYGLCRIRAAELLGLKTIPIVIDPARTEDEIHSSRAAENLQRQDLNPIEQASAVARVMDSLRHQAAEAAGFLNATGRPDEEVWDAPALAKVRQKQVELAARRLGKSETWVRDRDFLGRLSGKTRKYVLEGKLPLAHAREISKVADPEKRDEIAEAARIGGGSYQPREFPISMRDLRGLVAEQMNSLGNVPWKLELPVAGKPPCTTCPHNSANNAGLFEHNAPQFSRHGGGSKEPAAGVCLLRSCYAAKSGAANRAVGTYAKRAAKEIVAMPTKYRPAITAKSIEHHIPEFLRPGLVVERAKEELEKAPVNATAGKNKAAIRESSTYKAPAKTAEQTAKEKLDRARDDWGKKVSAAIKAMAKSRPLVLASIEQLENLDLFEYDARKKAKGEIGPERTKLIKWACEGTPEGLAEITRRLPFTYFSLYQLLEWNGAAELVVEQLGLKVPPAPKLEDFMPKEKPAAKAAAGKKPSGKKKAKKKAAKKAEPVMDMGDFDAEEED
jgi:ParB-like chromosome segregation protein Spo0J